MTTVSDLRRMLERKKGKKEEIKRVALELRKEIKENRIYAKHLEEAHAIIRLVGLETQKQLQYHISDIASLALESIFPEPYKLILDFVERRGKTECDILFEREDVRIDPLEAAGYGAVDVASFALRIASWSMSLQKTSNVIILDEPMRFLSAEYQENASQMIKEISEKLGIQFIIVTHEPILASYADRVFEVKIKNGVTKITES